MILGGLLPGKDDIFGKIFPSGIEPFIVQVLAMLVLTIAFIFLLFKPVRKLIKKRKDHIANTIEEADRKNETAEKYLLEAHNEIKEARMQAQEILSDAKKDAVVAHEEIIKKTEEEIVELKASAVEDIEKSKIKAEDEIRSSIIDVAFHASEKILMREVNSKDNKKIVDEFIDNLDEK